MEANRARWNQQQKALRAALERPELHDQAMALFLEQHAQVHASAATGCAGWSMEDELWQGLSEQVARGIPARGEQSIAWITWHIARIEDVTMNLLAADGAQVFDPTWSARLNLERSDTGNMMRGESIAGLSQAVDLDALRAYRAAVCRRTREVVPQLSDADLHARVRPERLHRAVEEGAVRAEVSDLLAYWGGLTVAGLLLMPPTRHNFVHFNEAIRIKRKTELSCK